MNKFIRMYGVGKNIVGLLTLIIVFVFVYQAGANALSTVLTIGIAFLVGVASWEGINLTLAILNYLARQLALPAYRAVLEKLKTPTQ